MCRDLKRYDVIVVGAGAAGLMCAIEAGRRGRSVAVLERNERIGKKILISGGGRCNFTNLHAKPENYLSSQPDFCKSALARFRPEHFIARMEEHSIPYHEKKLGQLFCDHSSRNITEMLEAECQEAQVEIFLNCKVEAIEKSLRFQLKTANGSMESDSLVIATGGLSFPHLGATGFGYDIARQFGLSLVETKPALVPFLCSNSLLEGLSGISFASRTTCESHLTDGKKSFDEQVLITHRGLSGPAILQISSYWEEGKEITLDLLPGIDGVELLQKQRTSGMTLNALLNHYLPQRFSEKWSSLAPLKPLSQWKKEELMTIGQLLNRWMICPTETEGYAKAEVTRGGVDPRELSSRTMECRSVPGLYFIGEVVDVTGQLGGFNFQWAWASGHAAGQVV